MGKSSTELAFEILEEKKRPMRPKEIVEIAMSDYGLKMQGKTPDATLNSNFINERKRRELRGEEPRFVRVGPGLWGLSKHLGVYYEQEP